MTLNYKTYDATDLQECPHEGYEVQFAQNVARDNSALFDSAVSNRYIADELVKLDAMPDGGKENE